MEMMMQNDYHSSHYGAHMGHPNPDWYYQSPQKMAPASCMMYSADNDASFRYHHQMAMPVMPTKGFRSDGTEVLRCKRRVDISKLSFKSHPNSVARRNERERNRVKHINTTFATLRQHLPCATKSKKLSKVDTLRSAIKYIKHLQQILDVQDKECEDEYDTRCCSESESEAPESPSALSESCSPVSTIKMEPETPRPSTPSTTTAASEGASSDFQSPPVSPTDVSRHQEAQGSCAEEDNYSSDPSYSYSPVAEELAELVDWFQ